MSLVPICCLDSSRSSSVCMGRMFFSSSSLLEGRLLSLMARESFLSTFCAREPEPKHSNQGKRLGGRADLQQKCPFLYFMGFRFHISVASSIDSSMKLSRGGNVDVVS